VSARSAAINQGHCHREATMQRGIITGLPFLLVTLCLIAVPVQAQDGAKKNPPETSNAGSTPTPQQAARAALAGFEKGNGDWKARMEALVRLAKIGPRAAPVLIEALKDTKPATREFAAQALVLYVDATAKPALERALADPTPGVRLYAIQALSMLGPLPRTKENERILTTDPTKFSVRPMMAAALERTDKPNLAEMRKTMAEYDLRNMDTARLGQITPDFTLTDNTGKAVRLSQFRGKTVVLRFILFDY
jgi:HEAT repeat protein